MNVRLKFIACLSAALLLSVPSPARKKTTEAVFSYFEYAGQDEFYEQNPLTDASSIYNPVLPGWYSDPAVCKRVMCRYGLIRE